MTTVSARSWTEGGRRVPLNPAPGEDVRPAATWGRHPALFLYAPRPLWNALRQPVDVIDVHEEPFALATAEILLLRRLARQRAPYVLYSAQNLDKRYPLPFRWLERAALRGAAGVSACNAQAARIVERKGFAGRARVIPLGVDLAAFAPADPTPLPPSGRVVVGFAGRLDHHKGAHVLIEAVAKEPTLVARLAGDGPERAELEALVRRLELTERVDFLGALEPHELPAFYRGLDVLAVPSLTTSSWVEQFGRVAVEAMACGVPVVASDSGALPDVVSGAGLLVAEGDATALGRALARVGADGDLRERLRASGSARAATLSWGRVADDYEALYRSALHEPLDVSTGPRPVEVIVVAYGQPQMLAAALAPLSGWTVHVIDNSSSPEVREVSERAGARYVDPGRNAGFSAGVNEGLRRLVDPTAHALLLNPDAVVSAEVIEQLRDALASDSGLASVGPAQIDEEGREARVFWPFPTPLGAWLDATGLGGLRRPEFVIGSVLLLRREALEQVGGFDEERFFLYAEEVDWARRAAHLGWRHCVVPGARALHAGAATSSDPRQREAQFHASQELYLRKHFGAWGWQVARGAVVAGALLRGLVLRGERGAAARHRARLYIDGPLRHGRAGGGAVRTLDRAEVTP